MDEKKEKVEKGETVKTEKSEKQAKISEKELLKAQIEELQKTADDYKDRWMRSVAEFDNHKKRSANDCYMARVDGTFDAVKKLLPIGDSLDRAMTMGLDENTAKGIEGLIKIFKDALSSLGIEEINPEGKPFDPNEAEAVMQVEKGEGDTSDNVKQVFEKGYKTKDRVLRYAKVSVIK